MFSFADVLLSYEYVHLKVLNGKLRSEKAECAALQARFLYPDVFSEEKGFEEIKNALHG